MMYVDPVKLALLKERMEMGTLTEKDFRTVVGDGGRFSLDGIQYRQEIVRTLAWAVFTTEYADALARALKGLWVVEVCAGKGLLARMMRDRGIDWRATDIEPWDGSTVEALDAMAAVEKYDAEVIFGSWIPYGSTLDYQLARTRKPCVFITEGWGGCIGSEDLWENQDAEDYEIFEWPLTDVPQWSCLHDYTVVVLPREYKGPLRDLVGSDPAASA